MLPMLHHESQSLRNIPGILICVMRNDAKLCFCLIIGIELHRHKAPCRIHAKAHYFNEQVSGKVNWKTTLLQLVCSIQYRDVNYSILYGGPYGIDDQDVRVSLLKIDLHTLINNEGDLQ